MLNLHSRTRSEERSSLDLNALKAFRSELQPERLWQCEVLQDRCIRIGVGRPIDDPFAGIAVGPKRLVVGIDEGSLY